MAEISPAERQHWRIRAKEAAEEALGRPVSNVEAADWMREQKRALKAGFVSSRADGGGHAPIKPAAQMSMGTMPLAHLVPDRAVEFSDDELTPLGRVLFKMVGVTATRNYINVAIQCNPAYHHLLSDVLALSGHPLLMDVYEVCADLNGDDDGE